MDKVFCLSVDETRKYYKFDSWDDDEKWGRCDALKIKKTDYALSRGAYADRYGYGWWWLRSLGGSSACACGVDEYGRTSWFEITEMCYESNGVRTALYLEK